MSSVTEQLMTRGMVPEARKWPWLKNNVHYETIMGSMAYGCADTSVKDRPADFDIYGFAFPPKQIMFPHLAGHLIMFGQKKKKHKTFLTFGTQPEGFEQMQSHHILDKDALGGQGKEYDLNIFNIVKFFQLCWENNPNMIDALYTPENMVVHCTNVGRMVRDNRKLFLSKLCWVKFRGYAHQQLKKMNDKNPEGDRRKIIDKFGYDVKFAYHIIRLFDEVEQILTEGDIDLQRAKEMMKAIRRGEWTAEEVRQWAMTKERALEKAYAECELPETPPEKPIKDLLFACIEDHYGSLDGAVERVGWQDEVLKEIDSVLERCRKQLYS